MGPLSNSALKRCSLRCSASAAWCREVMSRMVPMTRREVPCKPGTASPVNSIQRRSPWVVWNRPSHLVRVSFSRASSMARPNVSRSSGWTNFAANPATDSGSDDCARPKIPKNRSFSPATWSLSGFQVQMPSSAAPVASRRRSSRSRSARSPPSTVCPTRLDVINAQLSATTSNASVPIFAFCRPLAISASARATLAEASGCTSSSSKCSSPSRWSFRRDSSLGAAGLAVSSACPAT